MQGSKRDHAQESLVAHVEKLCGVNAPLQQQSCSPCSLRGLGPAAAGADSPDAALRGSRQLQSRGLPLIPPRIVGFDVFWMSEVWVFGGLMGLVCTALSPKP